jgi:hypothetical protein
MSILYRLIVFIAISKISFAQDDPCKYIDTLNQVSHCTNDSVVIKKTAVSHLKHQYENEWQFLCFSPNHENQSNSKFQQTYQFNSLVNESLVYKRKQAKFIIMFQDELLFEYIPDSIITSNRDLAQLKFSLTKSNDLSKIKPYSAISLETQKFNQYQFKLDTIGNQIRIRESSFLSPGTLLVQAGIKLNYNSHNEVNFGLASAKIKWINDKTIFESLQTDEIQGIQKDVKPKPDGGFALNGDFEKLFLKELKIEQTYRIFYPFYNRKSMDVEFRNKLSFMISKHLKSSLLTTYTYSETRWPPSFWRAELRIGYALEN